MMIQARPAARVPPVIHLELRAQPRLLTTLESLPGPQYHFPSSPVIRPSLANKVLENQQEQMTTPIPQRLRYLKKRLCISL